jgi:hypothetical protein
MGIKNGLNNMETKVTTDDVLRWLGGGFSKKGPPVNELARIIADLVNDEYDIKTARQEIILKINKNYDKSNY